MGNDARRSEQPNNGKPLSNEQTDEEWLLRNKMRALIPVSTHEFEDELVELITRYGLEQRLVELDLLEQAINREDYGLTLDASRFKMLRLNDLRKRLKLEELK